MPTTLFRQRALLKLIGYTTAEMRVGFCERGNLESGPMHKNTLADAVERLKADELEQVLNKMVARLRERGLFKGSKGHFALDATDLETMAKFAGAGVKKYVERKVDKRKKVVEVERLAYGFKVLIVYDVRLRLVVAAKVVPIHKHESNYTLELVRQATKNLGSKRGTASAIDRSGLSRRPGPLGAEAQPGHRFCGPGEGQNADN